MFKLLKGGICYSPEYIGKKDILVIYDRIHMVEDNIPENKLWDMEVIDCSGRLVCPGFIDQHVHITGGGGEGGPASRIKELEAEEVVLAGITTVVGLLGTDAVSRNIAGLLAKARALEAKGITAYIYTGNYSIPTATLTGRVLSDITFIDKIIGAGEIALSDYRSSYPSTSMLKELASEVMVGGLLGSKAGVMHIHMGDGKEGLTPLYKLLEETDFPIGMFVPTHLNRNKELFNQAVEYARKGGYIDLTAGEETQKGYSIPDALEILLKSDINAANITLSSDGNGSIPRNGNLGAGTVKQLFEDIKTSVIDKNLNIDKVVQTVTSNVARVLKLYPRKGALLPQSDADITILTSDGFSIDKVISKGVLLVNNGVAVKNAR